jgi:adenine C2-methylase RlmN of 23S rRNA A2503 and tRNA A37
VIAYNPTTRAYRRPDDHVIQKFLESIRVLNAPVILRQSAGIDIRGACGQLVTESSLNQSNNADWF